MSKVELEAAIEADPDDPAGYAVYADWLQAQGDPRGELIALQLACWRAPSDKKLASTARKYLATHAATLFPFDDNVLDARWHAGFVRAIRCRYSRDLTAVVAALVRHPAGRFLQSITLPNDVDAAPIIAFLLAERQPQTLVEVRCRPTHLGRYVAELEAAFPRFGRGLAPDWRALLQAIRDERKTDLKYDVGALPALELAGRFDIADAGNDDFARGLKHELEGNRQFGIVEAMRTTFTAESRDRFATTLAEQFFAGDTTPTRRWAFDALGAIGDAGAARWIRMQIGRWSIPRGQQAMELLGQLAKVTPMAISALFAIEADPRIAPDVRDFATSRVTTIAAVRHVLLDTLREGLPVLGAPPLEIVCGARVAWTADEADCQPI